tara:strand:+ start:2026 stop:3222 length:1197 start_codon:yes stop_codon:yes gene_type:complete
MYNSSLKLYLEINSSNYIFLVAKNDEQNDLKIIYKQEIPLKDIMHNRVFDFENIYLIVKENIYLIEKALKHTFKEIVLILDYFHPNFISLSGYKKLNGTQILRENIIYILNNLKSCVSINESKKTILHIFNTKFYLDKKIINNLPIGLFGNFYSHELSLILMNTDEFRSLKNIFNKSNLKIKKIFIKSFIEGAYISNTHKNHETFFKIRISNNESKIFFFENNSLKFEQKFRFGTDIIIKDVSKITSLKVENIKLIFTNLDFEKHIPEDEFIDKEFFKNMIYKKIKKKLVYDIALARIKEITEILIFKNINLKNYIKFSKDIFLEIDSKPQLKSLDIFYQNIFSNRGNLKLNFVNILSKESLLNTTDKLVHFGWDREVIPTTKTKKTLIRRVFEAIFS